MAFWSGWRGRNASSGQPLKSRESTAASYGALFQPAPLQCLRIPVRLQHRHFHGHGGGIRSLMTECCTGPPPNWTVFSLCFRSGSSSATSSLPGSAPVSTETMVLAGSLLAIMTVTGQAVTLSSVSSAPLALFIPGFFITMAQGIAMPLWAGRGDVEIPGLPARRPVSVCSCSTCALRSVAALRPSCRRHAARDDRGDTVVLFHAGLWLHPFLLNGPERAYSLIPGAALDHVGKARGLRAMKSRNWSGVPAWSRPAAENFSRASGETAPCGFRD